MIVLASQSPRRIELMREAGFDVLIVPAAIDETPRPDEDPIALVERLARAKAHTVATARKQVDETVIAADTVVVLDGQPLGKPTDKADAARMLHALSGKTHQVATGVCIERGTSIDSFVDITRVTFHHLSDDEIASYIATGEPLDKAGAYGIQGRYGRMLVRSIHGDFYNVVGLPISRVVRKIRARR